MEKQALAANFTSILSPQVASSAMWFLGRWVKSYLVPNEKYYKEVRNLNLTLEFFLFGLL
jgi:hypothetical protein